MKNMNSSTTSIPFRFITNNFLKIKLKSYLPVPTLIFLDVEEY